jgi:hypothetical protein
MIFTECPLLQEHFPFPIENKNAESTMQQALFMYFHFIHDANHVIKFVH